MEFLICSSRLLTSSGFSAVFPAAPYQRYISSILCLTELIRCEISVIMGIYRGQDLDISMTSRVYCHITEILASPTYLGDYWSSQRDTRLLPIVLFVCLFVCLAQQPPVDHGLLIHEISRSHTTTHHCREDSSGRVISSSHRPLPDNTQHLEQTKIHVSGGIRTAGNRSQTYALERAATETGCQCSYRLEFIYTL